MSNELDRMIKVMKASSIEAYDLLSIVYGAPDFFKKCKRQGSIQLDCSKCPIREKCSAMHEGKDVSKKECAEAIEAWVMNKKLVLPIQKKLHEKLLKLSFKKINAYVKNLEENRTCYAKKTKESILLLCPKASEWLVVFEAGDMNFEKNIEDLSLLNDFFEEIRKQSLKIIDQKINWTDEKELKKISFLLKEGNECLKSIEAFKRNWNGQKIDENP